MILKEVWLPFLSLEPHSKSSNQELQKGTIKWLGQFLLILPDTSHKIMLLVATCQLLPLSQSLAQFGCTKEVETVIDSEGVQNYASSGNLSVTTP